MGPKGLSAFILCMVTLAGVNARASEPNPCEITVRRGEQIKNVFLRLVRVGLEKNDLEVEDVRELSLLSKPSQPVRSGRDLQNVSYREAFRILLKRLNLTDWPAVVTELREILGRAAKSEALVAEAKEKTKRAFFWRKLGGPVFHHKPTSFFTSSNGEVFVATGGMHRSYIIRVGEPSLHTLEDTPHSTGRTDFFETSQGEVLYATLAFRQVHVTNARTGIPENYGSIDQVESIRKFDSINFGFRPLLFEEEGQLKVLVAPSHNIVEDPPFAVLNLADKKFRVGSWPAGKTNAIRAEDGSILVAGYFLKEGSLTFYLHDLLAKKNLVEVSVPKKIGVNDNLWPVSIVEHGKNELVLLDYRGASGYFVDGESKKLEMFASANHRGDQAIILGKDHHGDTQFATPGKNDEVFLGPVRGFVGGKNIEMGTLGLQEVSFFSPPTHSFILGWQYDMNSPTLHLFDLSTQDHISLPLPEAYNIQDISPPFYNPKNGSYCVYLREGNARWQLYQFYGPDL